MIPPAISKQAILTPKNPSNLAPVHTLMSKTTKHEMPHTMADLVRCLLVNEEVKAKNIGAAPTAFVMANNAMNSCDMCEVMVGNLVIYMLLCTACTPN